MKKIMTFVAGFLAAATMMAQQSDPVIMKINGKNITRSEFEYSYNKNNTDGVLDKKDVKEYVPLYINFKLKVAAAEDAKIDTLSAIKKELAGYKEQMVMPTIEDPEFIEREAHKTYEATAARFGGEDLLTASHILLLCRQDATPEQEAAIKVRIDSVYDALKGITDVEVLKTKFAELAQTVSDDKGSAVRGGALGQFGRKMMVPEFEEAAYALKAGEMSQPFKSSFGYHIILMHDRHPFEPYEFHHDAIIKFLESRGIKEVAAKAYIDSIATKRGIERPQVIEELFEKLAAQDMDAKYLAQEYYDGTLMYEICKNLIWDPAQADADGLAQYFKQNKKAYKWDEPRYAGIVIYAKDRAIIDNAKKTLKGVDEAEWGKALAAAYNNDSVRNVMTTYGLFKKGDNPNVDKLAFKQGTELKPRKDFPEIGVFGKVIKAPRTYTDVKGQVTTDYQQKKEDEWVEELRKKYEFIVYDDVVDTVNNH